MEDEIIARLAAQGIHPPRSWVQQCTAYLGLRIPPGTADLPSAVLHHFLETDLGSLGCTVSAMPKPLPDGVIPGPFVLQIVEVENATESTLDATATYVPGQEPSAANRCLVMRCTDGVQECEVLEYSHCPALRIRGMAGAKLQLFNVSARHGLLLLEPQNFTLLGGEVAELAEREKRKWEERLVQLSGKPYMLTQLRARCALPAPGSALTTVADAHDEEDDVN